MKEKVIILLEGTSEGGQVLAQPNGKGDIDIFRSISPQAFIVFPCKSLIALSDILLISSLIPLVHPSYFVPLRNPKKNVDKASTIISVRQKTCLEEEDRFYGGSILWCNSISDSDVRQRNRFWDNMESNVGEKVWKAISMLGIVTKDKAKDYRKKIA